MNKHLRTLTKFLKIAVFLLLAVSYQNCSGPSAPVNFQSTLSSSATDSSGNGGTYDGKPIGTFLRRSPSACSANNNWIGVLNIGESNAELIDDLCVALNYVIELIDTRLEFSAFNPDYIGLNSAIFEKSESATPLANAPVVDLWCHYQDAQFGLDVVVKTNVANTSTESTVYVGENLSSSSPQARKLAALPTVKSSSAGRLVASSSDGTLSTEVDISNPDLIKHPGRATIRYNNSNLNLSMSCRVASNKPAVLVKPSSALALYQMDQPFGAAANNSLVLDSSRNNRDAILRNSDGQGAQFVAGLIGGALSFDGVDDNVDITPLSSQTTNGFTFSSWVLPSNLINDKAILFGIYDPINYLPSYSNSLRVGFGLCNATAADKFQLTLDMRGTCQATGIDIVDGQWHMVTLTVQGSQATLYLDGVQVGQYAIITTLIPATDIWAIGQDYDSVTNQNDRYNGLIDEVIVWNSPLTAAEVADIYKNSGQ